MNATARNAQRDADRLAVMAGTFSHGGAHGWDGDARSDIPDDEHLRAAHGPILTAGDLAVLEAELARQRAADTIAVERDRASMPSIKPDRICSNLTKSPKTGDIGFIITVVARKSGVEVNGDLIGPREQGWASAAEHFGRHLAVLCKDDERKRQAAGQSRARHRRERDAVIAFIIASASVAVGGYNGERKGRKQARVLEPPAPAPSAWASPGCASPGQRRHARVARGPHRADEPVMSTRHPGAGHGGR